MQPPVNNMAMVEHAMAFMCVIGKRGQQPLDALLQSAKPADSRHTSVPPRGNTRWSARSLWAARSCRRCTAARIRYVHPALAVAGRDAGQDSGSPRLQIVQRTTEVTATSRRRPTAAAR